MSIITEAELRGFRNIDRSYKSLDESLSEYRRIDEANKTHIFLSHKHGELEFLDGAIALLRSLEINIYVDWLDEEMPTITSGETASKIKERIKQCDKFILLATEAAIDSEWCNWELGFGDAAKYKTGNIALFPVRKDGSNYEHNEYLQIYPSIEFVKKNSILIKGKGNSYFDEGYYVIHYKDNKEVPLYTKLKVWLKKK